MESDCRSVREIYLDNNATTKPIPKVREEVLRVLGDDFGNASSLHSTGKRARKYLSEARYWISRLIGSDVNNIVFTSSGTEANNMALYSAVKNSEGKGRIITTTVEHSSIRKMCKHLELNGAEIYYIKVDRSGILRVDELEKILKTVGKVDLVSIQWVNNETGVIQNMSDILDICKRYGVDLHTDAAQAVGKLHMDVKDLDIEFMTFSGHKFHSPQGCGGIYVKDKLKLHPIMFGGFQEEGFRPGTENLPGIVGMGKAAEIRCCDLDNTITKLKALRDRFESKILDSIPNACVNGDTKSRICNTTNIMFKGVDGRKLIKALDMKGVRCSQSSACTNFDPSPSYVLKAMGFSDEEAYSSVRFSFGVENTYDEIDKAVEIIKECHSKLRCGEIF